MQSWAIFILVIVHIVLIKTGGKSVCMLVYIPTTTQKLRQMLFFYSPFVFLYIYGFSSYMSVGIGKYALGLGVKDNNVVSPTSSHHFLVKALYELEKKLVPS